MRPGTGDLGEKDRPIDPMSGKNTPASPSPIRFSGQWTSGRAPALHAKEYLTTPAFEDESLPFCSCEADAAALVGRVTAPFIQRQIVIIARFRFYVNWFLKYG